MWIHGENNKILMEDIKEIQIDWEMNYWVELYEPVLLADQKYQQFHIVRLKITMKKIQWYEFVISLNINLYTHFYSNKNPI